VRLFSIISISCAIFLTHTASAQQAIGRSVVEGREIVILDNGKWVYSDAIDGECELLNSDLQFCGVGAGWTPTIPPSADVLATYRFDDRHYGQLIVEGLGENDGMTQEFMLDAVVQNAAAATGQRASDILIYEVYETPILGEEAVTIVYGLKFNGLDVVYANGISTSPTRTMQVMTYAIGKGFTDMHRTLQDEFLSQFKEVK